MSDRFDKCESHIERILCVDLERRFCADLKWDSQTPLVVMGHNFRADFFVECPSGKIVIECDGREFHEGQERDDLARDELMMEAGVATDIIRFRGCDLMFARESCLERLRLYFPYLFDGGAHAPSTSDLYLLSGAAHGSTDKTTYRFARNFLEWERIAGLRAMSVGTAFRCTKYSADGNRAMMQVRTACWNWEFRGNGEWLMADYFLELQHSLGKQKTDDAMNQRGGATSPRGPEKGNPSGTLTRHNAPVNRTA